jgi:hypothetical protein
VSDALIALVVALAACVQATAGMGFALILSPVLLVVLAPTTAIALMTALGLVLNLLVLLSRADRPHVDWEEVRPMLLAAVPGSVCGLLLLRSLPKPALEIGVGVIVVSLTLARRVPRPAPARVPAATGHAQSGRLAVGALAGALSTAIGVNGPPLAMWLASRGLRFGAIRDSLAALFLGMGTITALTLIPTFGDVHLRALLAGCCLAGVLAGHALGSRLHPRIGPKRLERLLSLIILASGVSAVTFGLAAL